MNAPHDPSDPLLQSLAEEAADLPARAAAVARQRSIQRRQTRQRFAFAAVISLLGVATSVLVPRRDVQPTTVAAHHVPSGNSPDLATFEPSPAPDAPIATGIVKVQTDEKAVGATSSLPSGLDEEQTEFVKAVRDLPLLLVRDGTGKVTRIHVVER